MGTRGLTTAFRRSVRHRRQPNHTMTDLDDFLVGIEVESPEIPSSTNDKLRSLGSKSDRLYTTISNEVGLEYSRHSDNLWPHGGQITSDVSVGLEIHSAPDEQIQGGIPTARARDWYPETLDTIEEYGTHVPVGKMQSRSQTAGMHIHFSHSDRHLAREIAEDLYEASKTDWMKVFVGSTVADEGGPPTAEVFRGDRHVSIRDELGQGNVVRERAEEGHYEWRLPEPATRDHFPLIMEYLDLLVADGPETANEFAKELVYGADNRLTAFKRANAIGVERMIPDVDIEDFEVLRSSEHRTHDLFDTVMARPDLPYIYNVQVGDGAYRDSYYVLRTMTGVDYEPPSGYEHVFPETESGDAWVVREESDGALEMADPDEATAVVEALNTWPEQEEDGFTETETTEVLFEALA